MYEGPWISCKLEFGFNNLHLPSRSQFFNSKVLSLSNHQEWGTIKHFQRPSADSPAPQCEPWRSRSAADCPNAEAAPRTPWNPTRSTMETPGNVVRADRHATCLARWSAAAGWACAVGAVAAAVAGEALAARAVARAVAVAAVGCRRSRRASRGAGRLPPVGSTATGQGPRGSRATAWAAQNPSWAGPRARKVLSAYRLAPRLPLQRLHEVTWGYMSWVGEKTVVTKSTLAQYECLFYDIWVTHMLYIYFARHLFIPCFINLDLSCWIFNKTFQAILFHESLTFASLLTGFGNNWQIAKRSSSPTW